mgnify:FL=1|jgi:hypothetical protein
MTLVYDAGGLIALDRGDRSSWVRLAGALRRREVPVTGAAVVGQVWRAAPRQARLARALAGMEVVPLDERSARAAGALLASAGLDDVADASVVLLAWDGDVVVTSDTADIAVLAGHLGRSIAILPP